MVKTVYVTGYKSFELNIFKDDAPEVHYLKQFIKHKIEQLLDEGLEWVLIQGQMGIELWTAEVVIELQRTYDSLKFAVITPFQGHTEKWNEHNQSKYANIIKHADYVDSIFIRHIKVLFNLNKQINLCLNIRIKHCSFMMRNKRQVLSSSSRC